MVAWLFPLTLKVSGNMNPGETLSAKSGMNCAIIHFINEFILHLQFLTGLLSYPSPLRLLLTLKPAGMNRTFKARLIILDLLFSTKECHRNSVKPSGNCYCIYGEKEHNIYPLTFTSS